MLLLKFNSIFFWGKKFKIKPKGQVELENLPEYPDESIGRRVNVSSDIPMVPTDRFLMTDLIPFSFFAIGMDNVMVSEKISPTTNGSPFELYQISKPISYK